MLGHSMINAVRGSLILEQLVLSRDAQPALPPAAGPAVASSG